MIVRISQRTAVRIRCGRYRSGPTVCMPFGAFPIDLRAVQIIANVFVATEMEQPIAANRFLVDDSAVVHKLERGSLGTVGGLINDVLLGVPLFSRRRNSIVDKLEGFRVEECGESTVGGILNGK